MIPFFNMQAIIDYLDQLDDVTKQVMRDYLAHSEDHAQLPAQIEIEKETGEAVDVFDDFLFAVIDQRHLHTRPSIKWYNPFTALGDRTGNSKRTKKKGICFHHSAVYHGIGPRGSVVKKYKAMTDGDPNTIESVLQGFYGNADPNDFAKWIRLNQAITDEQWAKAMGIAGRCRGEGPKDRWNGGLPYQVIRCANSVLVLNLDFEWVTWASNGANTDFLAFAWDANSRKEGVEDADDLIADVVFTVELAREEGHPIREFTTHAQWTNKPDDPGAEFIEKVMMPAAEQTGCVLDLDFKERSQYRSMREVLKKAV